MNTKTQARMAVELLPWIVAALVAAITSNLLHWAVDESRSRRTEGYVFVEERYCLINFTHEFGRPYSTPSNEELHKRLDNCIEKWEAWRILND